MKYNFINNNDSKLINKLKGLSPETNEIKKTPKQKAKEIGVRIIEAFPDYKGKDISGVGEALTGLVDGITGNDEMRELYRKLLPINPIPDNIEDKRLDILTVIAKYYRLIGQ